MVEGREVCFAWMPPIKRILFSWITRDVDQARESRAVVLLMYM
jgi:hypothetical protein